MYDILFIDNFTNIQTKCSVNIPEALNILGNLREHWEEVKNNTFSQETANLYANSGVYLEISEFYHPELDVKF